ncbi:MAG: tRNA (N6-threonylcarbamoyladenosine(37)-N6)-methyltransferase TrmO [Candidatus Helarchaeota archaeon]
MHNKQHAKSIENWIEKAKNIISEEIASELADSIELYNKMNQIFESIREKAKKSKVKDIKIEKTATETTSIKTNLSKSFIFKQIGVIHTPYTDNAPYQPISNDEGDFKIEIDPQYTKSLHRLDQFRYIYVIYYIDRVSREYKNIVSPPWTGGIEVGAFASRSPIRPNRLGLSIVQIKKVSDNVIFTTGLDVFDGTPLLDIKPYIKDLDSKCDANYGWIEDLEGYEHLLLHIKGIPHDY